ncbi:Spc7 kinetochore protein-domain-containing protein [Auriculariales sp. MPI-PUGE-AT-0066]|nr:Spc7 kinetochore protein-domain-containing protein [Auriculariales sp. MPI-PUGE-AT-0066]
MVTLAPSPRAARRRSSIRGPSIGDQSANISMAAKRHSTSLGRGVPLRGILKRRDTNAGDDTGSASDQTTGYTNAGQDDTTSHSMRVARVSFAANTNIRQFDKRKSIMMAEFADGSSDGSPENRMRPTNHTADSDSDSGEAQNDVVADDAANTGSFRPARRRSSTQRQPNVDDGSGEESMELDSGSENDDPGSEVTEGEDMSLDDEDVGGVIMTRRRSSVAAGKRRSSTRRMSFVARPPENEYTIPLGERVTSPKPPSALMLALESATHGGSIVVNNGDDDTPFYSASTQLGSDDLDDNQSQDMSLASNEEDEDEDAEDDGDRTLNLTQLSQRRSLLSDMSLDEPSAPSTPIHAASSAPNKTMTPPSLQVPPRGQFTFQPTATSSIPRFARPTGEFRPTRASSPKKTPVRPTFTAAFAPKSHSPRKRPAEDRDSPAKRQAVGETAADRRAVPVATVQPSPSTPSNASARRTSQQKSPARRQSMSPRKSTGVTLARLNARPSHAAIESATSRPSGPMPSSLQLTENVPPPRHSSSRLSEGFSAVTDSQLPEEETEVPATPSGERHFMPTTTPPETSPSAFAEVESSPVVETTPHHIISLAEFRGRQLSIIPEVITPAGSTRSSVMYPSLGEPLSSPIRSISQRDRTLARESLQTVASPVWTRPSPAAASPQLDSDSGYNLAEELAKLSTNDHLEPPAEHEEPEPEPEEDDDVLTMAEFFGECRIRFMEDVTCPRYSTAVGLSQDSLQDNDTYQLEDYCRAVFVDSVELDEYIWATGNIQALTATAKHSIERMDRDAAQDPPLTLRQYRHLNEDERYELQYLAGQTKTYSIATTKGHWYTWRTDWIVKLRDDIDSADAKLDFDESEINRGFNLLDNEEDVYATRDRVIAELEGEKTVIAAMEHSDKEYIAELQTAMAEQQAQIDSANDQLADQTAEQAVRSQRLADLNAEHQHLTDAVQVAERQQLEKGTQTVSNVATGLEHLRLLAHLHGWTVQRLTPNEVQIVHADRFVLTIPCRDWAVGIGPVRFERGPGPSGRSAKDRFAHATNYLLQTAERLTNAWIQGERRQFGQAISYAQVIRFIEPLWNSLAALRREIDILAVRYPIGIIRSDDSRTLSIRANVLLPERKAKAVVHFDLDDATAAAWPSSAQQSATHVSIAYGNAQANDVLSILLPRLKAATENTRSGLFFEACHAITQHYAEVH